MATLETGMGTPTRLEVELMDLRRDVRLVAATLNADAARWFGGSASLQQAASWGVMVRTLMAIRRHTDRGRPQHGGGVEPGLESLYGALVNVGREDEAERLRDLDQVQHLRRYTDKKIAHAKPGDLLGKSVWFPDVESSTFRYVWLSEATHEMSLAYMAHINPRLGMLDPVHRYRDAFEESMRTKGLPGVDWPPGEVFLTAG